MSNQAENRRLLEESQRTRNTRNARNFTETANSPAALEKINRARAKIIAKICLKRTDDSLTEYGAEAAAFSRLQKDALLTDEQITADVCRHYKPAKPPAPPKTKAELETAIQEKLFSEPAKKLHFVLPYPPSANRYWRHAAVFSPNAGKWIAVTYLSEEAKVYKETLRLFANRHHINPLRSNLRLTAYVYRPQKSGDLGNRLKVIEDALENIAYINDSQIAESHHYRREDAARPRVEIFLEEIV